MKKSLTFVLLICQASFAQENCATITNSEQYYNCSYIKKEAATKRLDAVYSKYLTEVTHSYTEHKNIGEDLLAKIKKSQVAWLNYMHATCDIYAFQIDENNQRHTAAINQCVTDMSEKRVTELAEMIANI